MTRSSGDLLSQLKAMHPQVIDLVLDRVWRLLDAMGNPQTKLAPVIHVAGTNGKGSTLAMIRAGLESAGHRTNGYSSPHLARFHERIRLSTGDISEPALAEILEETLRVNADGNITFFEATTCAALLAMSRDTADFSLLEVGLGGRLDATNVVSAPALTVITPISVDHTEFLGATLTEIAAEKAGILKRGVPCVVGRQDDAALDVIEARAARLGAPLLVQGQHWHVRQEHERLIFEDETGLCDLPLPVLIGDHQVENAGIALAALRHLAVTGDALDAAVTRAKWSARMQKLQLGPLVDSAPLADLWLDGGHNPAAGQALSTVMDRLSPRPTHLICGMLNTKDVTGYLRPLAKHAISLSAVTIPDEPMTLAGADTAAAARQAGFAHVSESPSVAQALADIVAQTPHARVLICGSLHLAGHVLMDNA
jgi:dihydrofolate synthase/folylpolyglutamate synthase